MMTPAARLVMRIGRIARSQRRSAHGLSPDPRQRIGPSYERACTCHSVTGAPASDAVARTSRNASARIRSIRRPASRCVSSCSSVQRASKSWTRSADPSNRPRRSDESVRGYRRQPSQCRAARIWRVLHCNDWRAEPSSLSHLCALFGPSRVESLGSWQCIETVGLDPMTERSGLARREE